MLWQLTASADKKEYFEGTFFMVLIYETNLQNHRIFSNKHSVFI